MTVGGRRVPFLTATRKARSAKATSIPTAKRTPSYARARRSITGIAVFAMTAALLAVPPGGVPQARAAVLQVGILACDDVTGSPYYCTVQAAIDDAVASDVIEIFAGTYNQSFTVDVSVTIEAETPGTVTIAGAGGSVVTTTTGTGVTLDGLRITGGDATNGGGVLVGPTAAATIINSQIADNAATGAGGGIYLSAGSSLLVDSISVTGNTANQGGGMYAVATGGSGLTVRSSTFAANTAVAEGGAFYQEAGSSDIINATVTDNDAGTGVIWIQGGTLDVRNTVVAENVGGGVPACGGPGTLVSSGGNLISRVSNLCAPVFTQPNDQIGTPADPLDPRLQSLSNNGGLGLSRVPESDSPLLDAADNTLISFTDQLGNTRAVDGVADTVAQADIGAVELDPLTVCTAGCDFTTIDGGAQSAANPGDVIRLGSQTFTGEFLRGNKDLTFQGSGVGVTVVDANGGTRVAQARGGATVTIRDMTLQGANRPGASGAGVSIFESGSDLTLERTRVTANSAGFDGGGVENSEIVTIIDSIIDNNSAGQEGGGVYTFGSGVTTIVRSTVNANTAGTSGAGVFTLGGTVSIINSTITANNATGTNGGGIAVSGGATTVNNSTVWDNAAGATYESVFQFGGGTITFSNSIIGEPASAQLLCGGTIGSGDHNILTKIDGCSFGTQTNDQVGTGAVPLDPQLGPLQNNGGLTTTLLPAGASIAVDSGNNATCTPIDQRGESRVVGTACDVGSVEVQLPVELVDQNSPVCSDVSGEPFCTIAAAVAAASISGNDVLVRPGTYVESFFVGGQTMTVRSTSGAPVTTIQAPANDVTPVTVNVGNLTLEGFTVTGANITASANGGGMFVNNSGGTLTVNDSIVTGNTSLSRGGGIASFGTLNINDSLITANQSQNGGGIFNSGSVTISDSTVSGNTSTGGGSGGGLHNATFGTPSANVVRSTISGNNAPNGGGIWAEANSALNVINSTISGNSASSGGGILSNGATIISHSTIALNNSTSDGAGVRKTSTYATASLSIVASIVAQNSGGATNPDCSASDPSTSAFFGPSILGAAGNDFGCDPTAVANPALLKGTPGSPLDPQIGALSDNGGPTHTHKISPASPAVDGAGGLCQAVDQRGVTRPQGSDCDIGSVEILVTTLQALIDAAAPGATINAPAGTFVENLEIGDGKRLVGAGAGATIIDGNGSRSVELIAGGVSGDATLEDLTVRNGAADESVGGNIDANTHNLTLINVDVEDGTADEGGNVYSTGALNITGGSITGGESFFTTGGGLYTSGPTTITGTTFSGNTAATNGGAMYIDDATVNVFDAIFVGNVATGNGGAVNVSAGSTLNIEAPLSCTVAPDPGSFPVETEFSNNTSLDSFGGAIYNAGTTVIYETLFFNNNADRGGAIDHAGGTLTVGCSNVDNNGALVGGQGINAGAFPLTVDATLFVRNGAGDPALHAEGDLIVTGSKFEGINQPIGIDIVGTSYNGANNEFLNHSRWAIFAQTTSGFTSIESTFTGNGSASDLGGAIFVQDPAAVIADGTFAGNVASEGGAIYNNFTVDVIRSTFTGNTATNGGAIATVSGLLVDESTFSGNTSLGFGGALYTAAGDMEIRNSTFSGNSATIGDPFAGGAALFNDGGRVINSTFSGNMTPNGGGGAIAVTFKPVEIWNSTLYQNTSFDFGGAVAAEPAGVPLAQIGNSILAENFVGSTESQCLNTGSLGYNVFGTVGCNPIASDQQGGDPIEPGFVPLDPVLGPLQDNGGPTATHAILNGSPAINNGDPGTGTVIAGSGVSASYQGSAFDDAGQVVLTNTTFQAGSYFSTDPIDVSQSFGAEFNFQITPDTPFGSEDSGDGFTFTLADSPTALGDIAGRLGIGDPAVPVSVNVVSAEFDTYQNGVEPTGNHVGLNVGTALDPVSTDAVDSVVELAAPGSFDDGTVWTGYVEYDALLKRLELRFSNTGVRPTDAYISLPIDLLDQFPGSVYPGFTAGTGAASAEHRIIDWQLIELSTCPSLDQRGVARPQNGLCDVGSFEAQNALSVGLNLVNDPVVDSGASTIATTDLPSDLATAPTDPTDPTDDNIGSAPVANLDTQSTDAEASPVANIPVANLDVAGAPVANLPVANLPADAQAVIDAILLSDVPIDGGWEVHLANSTTGLNDRPIQNVSFGEAMADEGVLMSLQVAGLSFNDMNVAGTPVANLTIAGLALGATPVANLPLDENDTTPAEILQTWCDLLATQPVNCNTLGINPATGDDNGYTLASLTIVGADTSALPVANIPVANLPVANLPVANIPVANLILIDSPVANLPVANLPVANLPVANVPVANIGPGGLPVANLPVANLPVANLPVANIPVANLHVANTPVANLPVANLPVANIGPDGLPVANLPVANIPVANIAAGLIDCSQPAVFDCSAPGATVGDAFLAGAIPPTSSVLDWQAYITFADLLAVGQLTDGFNGPVLDLEDLFVGILLGQLLELGLITLSDLEEFGGMTLGELLQAIIDAGLGFDIFLGDILLLLVNPADYPWEDLDLTGVDLQQFDSNPTPTVFSAELNVVSGGGSPADVVVNLPEDFFFVSASVTGPGGPLNFTFTQTGQTIALNLTAIPDGVTSFDVVTAASLSLGTASATATATVNGLEAMAGTLITVAEVLEPNDTPEQADIAPIMEDTIYLTHIAEQNDVDIYAIPGVLPGDRISVILSDMAEDFDLVLYQPELPPLRPGGVTPEGIATGVSDPGGFVDGDEQIQNEFSGDFPRATFNSGEPLRIYETSTQQGTSDEVITTATLQAAGTYYVQVHGSNGVTSADPYALRVERIESPSALACSPRPDPHPDNGVAGSVYMNAAFTDYNTLFLYSKQRLGDFYGNSAAQDIENALINLADQDLLGVRGIVVPIEAELGSNAYDDWDADRCNPLAANDLAAQLGAVVDSYRSAYPSIEYVTVIGDDAQAPFFRVPDYTEIANESEYAFSVSGSNNNELVGSLLSGFVLTDDPYGDANPLRIDGRDLYVSEVALGRLVETPAQILQSIGHFTTFSGRLDPATTSTGLSTGYDFIEDGSIAIAGALDDDPRRTTTELNEANGGLWTTQDLFNTINSTVADIVSLGAHMAHDGLLSAAEDDAGSQADLYSPADAQAQDLDVFLGGIIFSMGCHSGLNVSAVQVSQPSAPDWADTFNELGAVYVAETGFGYGDTEIVAYGEELMAQFATRLNGSMTVGQAMQFAKSFHAANLSQYSPYDEKVIMETVMYGLPFYNVGDPAAPPEQPEPIPLSIDPATGLPAATTSFDYGDGAPGPDGQLTLVSGGDRGDFYTANGDAQATAFNPIQPKATEDVSQVNLTGTGVFISELTSVDKDNFDPVFSRPTVDLAAREPEISLPGTFPLVLPGINTYLDLEGERDRLVVILGQFTDTDGRGLVGTERLFTHVEATVLYGDPTADQVLPTIRSVAALDSGAGGLLTFEVDAFDQDGSPGTLDVARVYVLYKLVGADGAWSQMDLTLVNGRWLGAVPSLGAQVEFLVQAVDGNGLVAYHSNKTAGNVSTDAPEPPAPGGPIEVTVDGSDPQPIYTTDPVEIVISGAEPGDLIQVGVDGDPFEPYVGPFDVSGEGPHIVLVDDGSGAEPGAIVFVIDTMGPEIFINSPVDGGVYVSGDDLVAAFSCTDAGSGVATCSGSSGGVPIAPGDVIDTTNVGARTLTVTSTDNAGNPQSQNTVQFEVAAALAVTPALLAVDDSATATLDFVPLPGVESVVFDWGDGSLDSECGSTCIVANGGVATATASHQYLETGVFVVTATLSRGDGSELVLASDFVVVYDPTAGFVTGGGWFDSPQGALVSDPFHTGRAEFGFVSKYKKKSNIPIGNTAFELIATDFEFSSTSYEWLIVNNAKAQYKGVGVVAGRTEVFKFKVTVRDADAKDNDAHTEDSFRIKIWLEDEDGNEIVHYDNGLGVDDNSEVGGTQPIGGGSIVIHVPRGNKKK